MEFLYNILQIPERCLVNKKITKVFFKRNFDLTNSEKAILDDTNIIVGIDWLASLSAQSINIPIFCNECYQFEEIQIISVQTVEKDFAKNHPKIIDLVQKYIPYAVLLCIWHDRTFVLNTCDKKINQNDNTRRIVEKKFTTEAVHPDGNTTLQQAFLKSLAFENLDKTNLKNCYDSYTFRIIALQTANIGGAFTPKTKAQVENDIENLEKIGILQKEIQLLENQAKNESQLKIRVEINMQLQLHLKQIEQLKALILAS